MTTHGRNPLGDRLLDATGLGRLFLLALVLLRLGVDRGLHSRLDTTASRVAYRKGVKSDSASLVRRQGRGNGPHRRR